MFCGVQVTALDGTVLHVTGTQTGFYVNGTRKENFDPTPAANNSCHSHELATCLLNASPSFAKVGYSSGLIDDKE